MEFKLKQNSFFKMNITFSGVVRFLSLIILIYIIDYVLALKDVSNPIKWKLIIIFGGIEVLFFFTITKLINLLIKISDNIKQK